MTTTAVYEQPPAMHQQACQALGLMRHSKLHVNSCCCPAVVAMQATGQSAAGQPAASKKQSLEEWLDGF